MATCCLGLAHASSRPRLSRDVLSEIHLQGFIRF